MAFSELDQNLNPLLDTADVEDLSILTDIITDNGKGRLTLEDTVKDTLVAAKNAKHFNANDRLQIAEEIRRYGSNSINTFLFGSVKSYMEIIKNVADHVGAKYSDSRTTSEIERAILLQIVEKSLEKMSEEEKIAFYKEFGINYLAGAGPAAFAALITAAKLAGFATYKLAAVIANATAKAVLGASLKFGATAGLMRGISVLTGPIGWAITAIWTVFDLSSPAYRVTVPCVIHLAYMREKANLIICKKEECNCQLAKSTKFCPECGTKVSDGKED